MKIEELFEVKISKDRGDEVTPESIKSAIDNLRNSPEYKQLIDLGFKEVGTPIQLKKGTIGFSKDLQLNAGGHKLSGELYYIYATGQCRLMSTDRLSKINSPQPSLDMDERYINCLKTILKYRVDSAERESKILILKGSQYTSFADLDILPKLSTLQISETSFENLEGCPQVTGKVRIINNPELSSLKTMPKRIGSFTLNTCPKITSLEGISPIITGDIYFGNLPGLTSLTNIHKYITKALTISIHAEVTSAILGLLKIEKLNNISTSFANVRNNELEKAVKIVNSYLKTDRNILKCQKELIQNGLKDYAKL